MSAEPPDAGNGALGLASTVEPDPLASTKVGLGNAPLHSEDQLGQDARRAAVKSKMFGTAPDGPKIGRYTVLDVLGEGGMGTVYAAHDDQLDRPVAIKLVKGGQTADARQRMLREAQAMAKLSHPNVVPVFEVGEHDGRLFVAMEYVRGHTLKRWRDDGVRPWTEVVEKYIQAGRGLVAAHEAGLVHRDFKPHNAVVGRDGRVRVLDFGLAARDAERLVPMAESSVMPPAAQGALDTPLTETGTVMGTPAYMAPEQFRGGSVDARADQFSWCVSLWEALCGDRPFHAERAAGVLARAAQEDLDIPKGTDAPSELHRLLARGLRFDPDQRWEDLGALLERLALLLSPPPSRWVVWRRIIGLVIGLMIALSLALVVVLQFAQERRQQRGPRGAPQLASTPPPHRGGPGQVTAAASEAEWRQECTILLPADALFAVDSAAFIPGSDPPLMELLATVQHPDHAGAPLEIGAHTSATAATDDGEDVTSKQAQAIRTFLTDRGVEPASLTTVGYGKSRPIASNATAEGRAENRRVELVNLRCKNAMTARPGSDLKNPFASTSPKRPAVEANPTDSTDVYRELALRLERLDPQDVEPSCTFEPVYLLPEGELSDAERKVLEFDAACWKARDQVCMLSISTVFSGDASADIVATDRIARVIKTELMGLGVPANHIKPVSKGSLEAEHHGPDSVRDRKATIICQGPR